MYLLRWDPPFPSRACKPSSIENSKIEKLSALNQQVGKILLFLDVAWPYAQFIVPMTFCVLSILINS
jgi:hypothetical protein